MIQCNKCDKYFDENSNLNCPYCKNEIVDTIKMIKCENEHYYDSNKNNNCPYCVNKDESMEAIETNYFKTMSEWVNKTDTNDLLTKVGAIPTKDEWVDKTEILFSVDDISSKLKVGDIFGRYIIDYKIASGGFSSVYKVTHKHLKHSYALKVFETFNTKKKEKTSNNMTAIAMTTLIYYLNK